ncbi:hypothetical protein [Rhizobium herbae]|uniref:Uncharacterized protein n=1 Tax=Rhizobium herbae TaxID=508661 RepID=A0ABS4ERY0_9HYPH|nr:hypothetical protein [Rhizobium herbae]MBP1860713.1 hypothetical protein [Rhizobium herbae]
MQHDCNPRIFNRNLDGNEQGLEVHFPELNFEEKDLSEMGLAYARISVFDHWLSAVEAKSSPLMSYSIALAAGKLDDYLAGEHKLLDPYRMLGHHGSICSYPRPFRKFDTVDVKREKILMDSLREKHLMDVYFMDFGIRVMGGYDRTDLLIAESPSELELLLSHVSQFGLFILPN